MSAFSNTMGVNEIEMTITARAFCPLGKDGYTNNFTILFLPNEVIPDYLDIEKWVNENIIESQVLTIEDSVSVIFKYLNDTYKPKFLTVHSYVDDAVHFPVKVTKHLQV